MKRYGGDSWRVMVRSDPATVAADIFDYNNGSYEALFLLMEPGLYTLDIKLDYTLCDGLRNPPVEWFHKGKEKNQGNGINNCAIAHINSGLRNLRPAKVVYASSGD